MPVLNPSLPGIYCAGMAGDGGVVSTNNERIVLGPSAGGVQWLNDREIACQYYGAHPPQLVAVDLFTGVARTLWLDGVNKIVAGAGHWFAVTMRTGVLLDGLQVDYNVRAFAGEYMAWFPWNGTGLTIRHLPSGADRHLSDVLDPGGIVQLFPDGGVIWGEAGEIRSDGVSGLPSHISVIPGGFGWQKAFRIGGVWWVTYQSYGLASVVAHPVGEFVGYQWPAPLAYFLDAGLLDQSRPRIVWSRGPAEAPSEIEVHDVDLSQPRVNLTVPISGTPVPIPGPIPVPVPEPPKMPDPQMPAAAFLIAKRMFDEKRMDYPGTEEGARAWTKAVAEQLKFSLPADGWGAKARDANAPLSKDVVARPRKDGSGLIEGWELLTSAGALGPRQFTNPPVYQSLEGQAVIPVDAVNHLGVTLPVPEPVPDPHPVPSPGNEDQLLIWMVDIERRLTKLEEWTRGV